MSGLPLRGVTAALAAVALVCSACASETTPPAMEDTPRATATEPPTTTDHAQVTTPPAETDASSDEPQARAEDPELEPEPEPEDTEPEPEDPELEPEPKAQDTEPEPKAQDTEPEPEDPELEPEPEPEDTEPAPEDPELEPEPKAEDTEPAPEDPELEPEPKAEDTEPAPEDPELEPEPKAEDTEPAPEDPELEPEPKAAAGGGGDPDRPGEGVTVMAGRADWDSGYFQAALYEQLLEELGYSVGDPWETGPDIAYTALAQGRMDYWPNSWYPHNYKWLDRELPDGSLVEDHVSVVGELLFEGVLSGFVVTRSFADAYGVYTMDDLNDSPEALAAFDATDLVPGNGKAEIYGCHSLFPNCQGTIYNMIAFSGWDNIVQLTGDYRTYIELAHRDADNNVPMVIFTWAPSLYFARLRPGDNVYWMGVDNILDDSNPAGVEGGEEHDQRGPDGAGGYAAIGADQCPSATEQPDGRCPIGWLARHILVTANSEFLEANPAARALLEAVKLTPLDVSLAHLAQREHGAHPDDLAAQWIADNRNLADQWLAAARAAG